MYYGGLSPDFTVDRVLVGTADGERFGFSLAAGDFSANGISEIAVGAYSYDAASLNLGRIYLFDGGNAPDTIPDRTITGDVAGVKFGWSLTAGKVTADTIDDLIMGTDGYQLSGFSAGKVYVFDGGPSFDSIPAYTYDLGQPADDFLGFTVASAVDINRDGTDDFITGMPGSNDGGNSVGGAVLFSGGTAITVDTSTSGTSVDEEMGHAVHLWRHYGTGNGTAFVTGAIGYDNFRGRIALFTNPDTASSNQSPSLAPVGNKTVSLGDTLVFQVTATDPDLDSLTLRTSSLPPGAAFYDSGNGASSFFWAPTQSDTGTYDVTFYVSDSLLVDSENVTIAVLDTVTCCIGMTGNVDNDPGEIVDIGDLTVLIDYLFISHTPPNCLDEANIDGDAGGIVDIGDLTRLIDYLFISNTQSAVCL